MKKKLIFIVDDQPSTRKLISCWLDDDYEVREFADGFTFLEALKDGPDAVCLDIMMPGMDGVETLKQVRIKAPDLPVIMVTAAESLQTSKGAGAGLFI